MEGVEDSYNSALSQFPLPSRPIGIDYSNMDRAQDGYSSAMPQYPPPSRPIDIDYTNMSEESYQTKFYGDCYECYNQESREQDVSNDDLFRIFREVAGEEDGSNAQEIFRSFFSKVKTEVHFDRLEKFYRLVNPENNLDPPGYEERGINIEASSTKGDVKHKLERFKIKNLNLGGVVKDEKKI